MKNCMLIGNYSVIFHANDPMMRKKTMKRLGMSCGMYALVDSDSGGRIIASKEAVGGIKPVSARRSGPDGKSLRTFDFA